jgi:hypothetical protein
MSGGLPIVSVDRHVEITWNPLGQHAGVADLRCGERNACGERNTCSLGLRLKGIAFAKVFTCALRRAVQACELAALAIQHGTITISCNGIIANTSVFVPMRFTNGGPSGDCFATAVLRTKCELEKDSPEA